MLNFFKKQFIRVRYSESRPLPIVAINFLIECIKKVHNNYFEIIIEDDYWLGLTLDYVALLTKILNIMK